MKKKIFVISIIALVNVNFAKSQCTTIIHNGNTGTANYVPVFNGLSCIQNGIIQDNGTNVGIGGAGSYKLDVNGDVNSAQGNAYRMAGNKILWYNGAITSNIFTGVGAGASITGGISNAFTGYQAGTNTTDGNHNIAVGWQALYNNVHGWYSTAIGYQSLYKCTALTITKAGVTDTLDNVAVGYKALYHTLAYGCVGIGWKAAYMNDSGCATIAIGEEAVRENTTGNGNIGIGASAIHTNTTGSQNTCVGDNSAAGSGGNAYSYNSFFGAQTGSVITTGGHNVCSGYQALNSLTSGSYNTAVGTNSLKSVTTASYLSAFGDSALTSNTSGSSNSAFGYNALRSNITGNNNTAMGHYSMQYNKYAGSNVAIGYYALSSLAYGSSSWDSYNTAIGGGALGNLTPTSTSTGYNTAVGYSAGYGNTAYNGDRNTFVGGLCGHYNTGNFNVFTGYEAGYNNSSGANNSFFGYNAGLGTNTGSNNTAIGRKAGFNLSSSDSNTFVGAFADMGAAQTFHNCGGFGYGAIPTASGMFIIGGTNANYVGGPSNWHNTSDGRFKTNVQENVKGLDFIKKLRPVTYKMDTKSLEGFINPRTDSLGNVLSVSGDYSKSMSIVHSGFIAQEVEQAAQACNFQSSIVHTPQNSKDPYALAYGEIVVPLVKAVQELAKKDSTKDSKIDSLTKVAAKQDSINRALQNQITQLMNTVNNCCSNPGTGNRTSAPGNQNNNSSAQDVELSDKNIIVLDQNSPNPFAEQTTITYNIPEQFGFAQILFYNNLGQMIKSVDIKQKGKGRLNVFASDLSNGIYSYSLIIDGKIIDSKKMLKSE